MKIHLACEGRSAQLILPFHFLPFDLVLNLTKFPIKRTEICARQNLLQHLSSSTLLVSGFHRVSMPHTVLM